jgi:hypothetical protein
MAAVTFQLVSVQENLNQAPARQADANGTNTPLNPTQAQGAPVPQDTVTLAGQAAQGQQTGQNQQNPLQQTVLFVAEAGVFTGNNRAAAGTQSAAAGVQNPAAEQFGASTDPPNVANGLAAALQAAAAKIARRDLQPTQQQELQQLDQTLQQLGIDPQSISLFNQLALLLYANDPAALQQFISQLQHSTQQLLQQGVTATPAANQNHGNPNQTAAVNPGQTPAAQTTASAALQGNSTLIQFQELQFTVAAVGGQVQLPGNTAAAGSQGQSLNVTF